MKAYVIKSRNDYGDGDFQVYIAEYDSEDLAIDKSECEPTKKLFLSVDEDQFNALKVGEKYQIEFKEMPE